MVGGVHIAKQQIIGADVKCRTDPDDVFRAQCFFAKFRRGNGLWCDARFFSQFFPVSCGAVSCDAVSGFQSVLISRPSVHLQV